MRHQKERHQNQLEHLLKQYEVMSQKGAVSFYEEAVFIDMIDLLENGGQWHKATSLAEAAITQHPFSADLYLRKAELLLNRNMIEECLVTIEQAEIFAPCNVNLRILRAELLTAKGAFIEALEVLDQLKSHTSFEELAEIFFTEALIYEDLKDLQAMFRSLRRCLMTNPSHTEGYGKMLLLIEKRGYYKESVKFHNKLIDKNAYNWQAWLNLGMAYRGLNKKQEAVEAFEFTFAINEQCSMAYLEAADLLLDLGENERARLVYEVAIFNTQETPELLSQLGYCHQLLRNFKVAIDFYERVLELDKYDSDVYFRIGECAKSLQQWPRAIDCFKKAIKLSNDREEYHAGLADTYFQCNELPNARASYRRAANIGCDDVTYWLRYAYFLLNIGEIKAAMRVLDKADMYAGGTEIEYCRIACLYMQGKKNEALYKLGEALQCDYEMHKTLFNWRPELAENADLIAVIKAFLP
jgi:tetratricopeptide (TPR) repeat protein